MLVILPKLVWCMLALEVALIPPLLVQWDLILTTAGGFLQGPKPLSSEKLQGIKPSKDLESLRKPLQKNKKRRTIKPRLFGGVALQPPSVARVPSTGWIFQLFLASHMVLVTEPHGDCHKKLWPLPPMKLQVKMSLAFWLPQRVSGLSPQIGKTDLISSILTCFVSR